MDPRVKPAADDRERGKGDRHGSGTRRGHSQSRRGLADAGARRGGCVEGAVVTEAIDVIESGKPKTLEFGVADDTAWKVGLSCGGTIRVFVEKVE
jgi:xanthine/CO dehydrogenase XdhC/CoxF family maturation factor